MHADERAVLRGLLQRLEDGGVVDHEHVGVGHEEFEAGDAFATMSSMSSSPCSPASEPRSVTIMCRE